MMVSGLLPASAPYDSIINLAMYFDNRMPDIAVVKRAFADHVVAHMRFHSIPFQAKDCGPVDWVCQRVDIEKHFFTRNAAMRATLETEGFAVSGEGAVRREAEEILNTKLTTKADGRPWWEVHAIYAPPAPGQPADTKGAGMLLVRIHHSIGDGISLTEVFADVLTDAEGTPLSKLSLFAPAPRGGRGGSFNPVAALRFAGSAVVSFFQILGLATIGGDTSCAFQNESRQLPYQANRFTVYFPSHALALVKKIKDTLGAAGKTAITVNDVEFALFAGAIRRFLARHGEDASKVHLRALTPFAVPETPCETSRYQTVLRNFWTFVVNDLPLRDATAAQRVVSSHRSWSRLKTTALIPVAFFVHRLNSALPGFMQKQTSNDLMKRVSVVFSNVPGPQKQVFLCNEPVGSIHMMYPNVSQQVGILSVHGMLHMAMVMSTNRDAGQTRRWLADCFLEELIEVAASVGVSRMDVMRQIRMV